MPDHTTRSGAPQGDDDPVGRVSGAAEREPLPGEELPELDDLLGDPAVWHDPPPGLEDDIVAAITAEAQAFRSMAGRRPTSPSPAVTSAAVTSRAPRRRPRWLEAIAAAVLVVIGFGAAVLSTGGEDEPGADPDATIELAGDPELAPEASAVARVTETPSGLLILLDVSNLDEAPDGHYYQAWVRNADDGVSAGTFHLRGGDAEIELWSGVPLADYPRFSVTLQEEGAGPESSGVVVLRGELD